MSSFDDGDRERIRAELVEAGRELFAQFGFERTRIRDVTEAVDIGTSTFCQFFDSKEALYVVVLTAEREAIEEMLKTAVDSAETPKDEVRTLLRTLFSEVRSNPLIARLIVEGELRQIQDQLSDAECRSVSTSPSEDRITLAERWAGIEEFRYDDPDLIRGIFRSLVFVTRSQETLIGTLHVEEYAEVEERLIETIVDGLFIE
ncbi:AcrR family transcriptional regulator [Halorubrum alkaliphilum]|uniref:AcrR family transcriptional regulator n=1 Tax=Halorubrum alkaliphilum TaxID=261290 RepID=A0A8T4GDU4_9EURY|nr:TetR/AcrR family transcriptional regulator [Halorubrum alkaliphilum]MBP1921820.1 AcrR family transcriptional regulator [Halorubrum alkaliphilum]